MALFHLGELVPALEHLEQGVALYDPQKHRPGRFQGSGQDAKVTCLSYAAWVLWHLGYPDQAQKRIDEALTLAEELSHPFSLAFALNFSAALNQRLHNIQAVQGQIEALMMLSREQGFSYWSAWGTIRQGWVLTEQGQVEEGITQGHQGLAAMQATGAALNRSYGLVWLAEAYGKMGQFEEGLSVLAEAFTVVDKTGDRTFEAELYRLKGELTLQQQFKVQSSEFKVPSPQYLTPSTQVEVEQEAEECFHKAIEIARKQQAKSLELRAVMSLVRLWQQQYKQHEARNMLAEIYGWFIEGLDTKDLQEAKALLEELR
jgi:predicted ATPase